MEALIKPLARRADTWYDLIHGSSDDSYKYKACLFVVN